MSNFNNYKLFKNVGIRSSDNKLIVMNVNKSNNVSFYSSDGGTNNIDVMSINSIINKSQNEDLNLSSLNGTTINPVITINNNHNDCRIMTNLNVAGNVNITKNLNVSNTVVNHNLIIPKYDNDNSLLSNVIGSIYYNTTENMYEGYSNDGWQPLGGFSKTKDATIHKNLNVSGNVNITKNVNVSGNVNITDGGMVKTTGIGSFGSLSVMTNLNVSGNINLTDGGMVKTTGIGSFGSITTAGQGSFGSLSVASNTQVTNLNAHKLGGNLPSAFATATHNHDNTNITPDAVGINTPAPTGVTTLKVSGLIEATNSLLYFEGGNQSGDGRYTSTPTLNHYTRQYIQMQAPTGRDSSMAFDNTRDWFIGTMWSGTASISQIVFTTRVHGSLALKYVAYIRSWYSGDSAGSAMNFTGQHRCVPQNIDFYNNVDNYVGLIVYATGDYKTYSNSQEKLTTDKEAITINDSLPIIDLSNKKKQKSVFGIISNKEEEERTFSAGAFCTPYPNTNDDKRLYINSVGEGAIWIVNTNGTLENGDYIEASDVIGMGEKQDSEFLANYTVAKITCDCNFDTSSTKYNCVEFVDPTSGNTYKKAFVGCSYHCG